MPGLSNAQWNYEQPEDDAPDDTRETAVAACADFTEECGEEYAAVLTEWIHDNKMTIAIIHHDCEDQEMFVAAVHSLDQLGDFLVAVRAYMDTAEIRFDSTVAPYRPRVFAGVIQKEEVL